jgi:UDP-N-acetylmuramoyl-tripeptide--D-alanyl-D-alanine ligase
MLLWLVYVLFFLPALLKQNVLWLFLWQNREYRQDKMWDYLTLPESKKVVFDTWSKIRVLVVILNLGLIFFSDLNYYVQVVGILLILFLSAFESVNYLNKAILKKVKLPTLSAKAGLIFLFSFLSSIALPVFLFYYLTDINLDLSTSNLFSLILWTNLVLFLVPFIMGYWILMVFPFDLVTKNNLFKKARIYRESLKDLKTIAISGAFGKTTTKEILSFILESDYKVEKILKNQNSNVSCARRTLKLQKDTQFFICELGAYKRGDGNEISQFIKPNASIITGLNYQHFSLFGSEKNIILAESESLKFLNPGEIAIVNWSSQLCHKIEFPKGIKIIKCAIQDENNKQEDIQYLAKNIQIDFDGSSFDLEINSGEINQTVHLHTNLPSKGTIQNILHVIAFCLEHDLVKLSEIKRKLSRLPEIEGRMQVFAKPWGKVVYNQYNNPDGVANALELFAKHTNEKIVVLDDLLELGNKSKEIHQKVAGEIFETKPDLVILLGRNFSDLIKNQLIAKKFPAKKIVILANKDYTNVKKQIRKANEKQTDALILLMGYQSKGFLDI